MAEIINELVIVSGRYRGRRIPLTKDTLRIGRDRACEIMLDDEVASRVHSEIVQRDGQFVLRDLQSTNGTYLNDTRVTESPLQNGDKIGIGDVILMLQLAQEKKKDTAQVVFSKEQQDVSSCFSISLTDSHFLEMKESATIPDAQRQFALLYEFMLDAAGILHPPALLDRALVHLFKAFTPDRGLAMLLTPEGEPGFCATKISDTVAEHNQIAISQTMVRQLLQKKESFLSIDASSDERLTASKSLHNMRVNSIMGAPLLVKDKVLGMVYLDTVATGKSFSEQNLKLCTAMAAQLAIYLENTRLYTELLDATEFNNSILRSLGSGIIVVNEFGRVIRVNQATQKIIGKTETDLLGCSLEQFPELTELNSVICNTLTTTQPEDRHELLIRNASQSVPLKLTTSVLSDHLGKIIGVVANFYNLTPIRNLEEQVRRSQHFAILGQMAAGVAHEIRNPLNSIRGFVQLLQEAPNKNTAEYTQIILEEVDRTNRIVQDLLDFSQQRDLTLTALQLNKLLEELISGLQADAQKSQVLLKLIPCSEALPEVLGNNDKLRQVFYNIILNAVQACKSDGRVTITISLVENEVTKPRDQEIAPEKRRELAITVTDNGCGIDPSIIPKIFDPFFTHKDSGTGLGLAISQKIVQQHDGRIEVKSELSKGSSFTVFLPAI
ncbi:MAG: ATP-binding protein [Planctomycetota bacterium]